MVQVVGAREVELRQLSEFFHVEEAGDEAAFFPEWREGLLELMDEERATLDKIQASYFHLLRYPPLLEKTIQLAIIGPLLFLAGCFLPPFHPKTEESIEIAAQDGDFVIRGSIDILLLRDDVWLAVIESKKASFSVEAGLPQLLSYMLAQPDQDRPSFGALMTGGEFLFVKLVHGDVPRYATSTLFALRNKRNRDIYDAFAVLKRLMQM